ncbi:MAG: hypothetical protein IIC04_06645 [Proteobacteria bacterium]|nr:hypothetical protein [Pseudomonadota bacterium]
MYYSRCFGKFFTTMQKHQEDVALIDDDLKINDEKVTTSAALMAAKQVAERQRVLAFELRKKAAVARQNEVATDRQGEKADDGGIDKADRADKGEEPKLAGGMGEKVAVDKDGDVPGSKTTSDSAREEAPDPTRGKTIVDLNA